MQETSGGKRVEAEGDQERCWCHLGTSRAMSNALPQINLPEKGQDSPIISYDFPQVAAKDLPCGFSVGFQ